MEANIGTITEISLPPGTLEDGRGDNEMKHKGADLMSPHELDENLGEPQPTVFSQVNASMDMQLVEEAGSRAEQAHDSSELSKSISLKYGSIQPKDSKLRSSGYQKFNKSI